MPLRAHEAAADRDAIAVGEADRGDRAPIALEVVDETAVDADAAGGEPASSPASITGAPFVKTVSWSVQREISRARSARSALSPIRARGRSRSSQPSHAAQLKSVMP